MASTFCEADVYSCHTSECARRLGLACWSASSWGTTNPRCTSSRPAPQVGACRARLSGWPAEAARPGGCQGCLCGGFGPHNSMLFDAGPLGPMHAHSGTAGRTCLDRTGAWRVAWPTFWWNTSCSNAAEWRRPLCLTFEAEFIPRIVSCLDFRDRVAVTHNRSECPATSLQVKLCRG